MKCRSYSLYIMLTATHSV